MAPPPSSAPGTDATAEEPAPSRPPLPAVLAGAALAAGALGCALLLGGGGAHHEIDGLPSAGPVTTWGLPLARLAHDLCAVLTVGALLTATVLAPAGPARRGIARAGGRWALGWAVCAALVFLLTLSDVAGLPLRGTLASDVLVSVGLHLPQGQAFLLVTVLALVIAAVAHRPVGDGGRALLLALALCAVLPPACTGHAATAADRDLAVSALMLHVAAVAVWVGGLAGVLVWLRRSADLARAVARFSVLALACYVAVGVTGVVSAWTRIDDPARLWETGYGLLVLGKTAALLVLGGFGWVHRRRTIAAIGRGGRWFLRLAAGELGVMAATVGLAVALARTPPPQPGGAVAPPTPLGRPLPAFTVTGLLEQVRPDPIVLLALVAAAVPYLGGVLRLARRGVPWPVRRTAAWLLGLLLLGYALAGGPAAYAPALFSAFALQHALAAVAAPALLVCGAPLGLALRSAAPDRPYGDLPGRIARSRPLAVLRRPPVAFAAHAVPYLLLYPAGLVEVVQSGQVARLVAGAIAVAGGVLFCAVVAGVDPLPHLGTVAMRLRLLAAAAILQAAVLVFLVAGPVLSRSWYGRLDLSWAPDRLADQRLGALVGAGIVGGTLLALALFLLRRWTAARARERAERP